MVEPGFTIVDGEYLKVCPEGQDCTNQETSLQLKVVKPGTPGAIRIRRNDKVFNVLPKILEENEFRGNGSAKRKPAGSNNTSRRNGDNADGGYLQIGPSDIANQVEGLIANGGNEDNEGNYLLVEPGFTIVDGEYLKVCPEGQDCTNQETSLQLKVVKPGTPGAIRIRRNDKVFNVLPKILEENEFRGNGSAKRKPAGSNNTSRRNGDNASSGYLEIGPSDIAEKIPGLTSNNEGDYLMIEAGFKLVDGEYLKVCPEGQDCTNQETSLQLLVVNSETPGAIIIKDSDGNEISVLPITQKKYDENEVVEEGYGEITASKKRNVFSAFSKKIKRAKNTVKRFSAAAFKRIGKGRKKK